MRGYDCGQRLAAEARLSHLLLGGRSRTNLFLTAKIFLSGTLLCQSYSEYLLACRKIVDATCYYLSVVAMVVVVVVVVAFKVVA